MRASITPTSKKICKLCTLCLIVARLSVTHQVLSFVTTSVASTTRIRAAAQTAGYQKSGRQQPVGSSSSNCPLLFATPLDEEKAENKNVLEQWDHEESLLVMSLSPLPGVSCEDSYSRISRYIQGFPVAAVLPVQPLQALPTGDGGLEIKFLRKTTRINSGVDGGVRFFVRVANQDAKRDRIEVVMKRNSEGQSTPNLIAEKLIAQSFAKGISMGGDCDDDDGNRESSLIRVPKTRIESPTKDMAKIQSVFHKWMGI